MLPPPPPWAGRHWAWGSSLWLVSLRTKPKQPESWALVLPGLSQPVCPWPAPSPSLGDTSSLKIAEWPASCVAALAASSMVKSVVPFFPSRL